MKVLLSLFFVASSMGVNMLGVETNLTQTQIPINGAGTCSVSYIGSTMLTLEYIK